MRALCLYLPRWPTDLRRRATPADRRALVTVATAAQRQVVAACCAAAGHAGIVPGMSLAHARALLPPGRLRIEPHDVDRDRAALHQLAEWSTALLPRVMVDPEHDALLADVTGCARLYRGQRELVRQLAAALRRGRFHRRIACAPTFGAAWALAHHDARPLRVVDDAALHDALAPLPVAALRVDAATCDALAEVGVETIGQLAALPRASLPSRFDGELLHRLDQALGRAFEGIEPIAQVGPPEARRDFAGPVKNLEAIALAARQLLDALCRQLLEAESGGSGFALRLERYEAGPVTLTFAASRPSRDARHLWQLLWPKLERAHLGHGAETLVLTATAVRRLPHRQVGPEAPEVQHEHELGELLDRLDARLGSDQMMRVAPHESHLPERAYRRRDEGTTTKEPPAAVTPHERPSRLLHPPEPAEVMAVTPDGPVVRVCWRGEPHAVTACVGPERITSEWWRGPAPQRDYFRVRTDAGRWLWLYRAGRRDGHAPRGGWFVHGLWA